MRPASNPGEFLDISVSVQIVDARIEIGANTDRGYRAAPYRGCTAAASSLGTGWGKNSRVEWRSLIA